MEENPEKQWSGKQGKKTFKREMVIHNVNYFAKSNWVIYWEEANGFRNLEMKSVLWQGTLKGATQLQWSRIWWKVWNSWHWRKNGWKENSLRGVRAKKGERRLAEFFKKSSAWTKDFSFPYLKQTNKKGPENLALLLLARVLIICIYFSIIRRSRHSE